MAPRFDYSSKNLGKRLYKGRTIPVQVSEVREVVDEKDGHPVPQLVVSWVPPSKAHETSSYAGGQDSIPPNSDLGKLIKSFQNVGIDDIGEDDFGQILNEFFWIEVVPVQTPQGTSFQRFPQRRMTPEEIQEHFNIKEPLADLKPLVSNLEARLDHVTIDNVLGMCLGDPEVKKYVPEVSDAIDNGKFISWIEAHTNLRYHEASQVLALPETWDDIGEEGD